MSKKKSSSRLTTTLFLAAAGGAIGFFAARVGVQVSKELPPSIFFTLVALSIPLFFLVIALHEGGHAWAGVRVGFDFKLYVVGPFLWEKTVSGWAFRWNRNVNILGGMVICAPTTRHNIQQRFAWFAAGGPLGSLAGGLVFGLIYLILPETKNTIGLILSGAIAQLLWFSSITFLLTAIPFHSGGFSSDGARVLRLFRGGETAQFEILLLSIVSSTMSGVRWSQLNPQELEEAAELAKKINAPMGVYTHTYRYYAALDRGDFLQAEEHLSHYMADSESIPKGLQNMVWLDATYFYAFVKRDQKQAEQYWNQYQPTALIPKATVLSAEAALRFCQHDYDQALRLIEQTLSEIPNMMDKGFGIGLRERTLKLKEEIESKRLSLAS